MSDSVFTETIIFNFTLVVYIIIKCKATIASAVGKKYSWQTGLTGGGSRACGCPGEDR